MSEDLSMQYLINKYFEKDPVSASHNLETMDAEEAVKVIKMIPPEMAGQAIRHVNTTLGAYLLQQIPDELFGEIIGHLDSQQASNIFSSLSPELRGHFLERLSTKKKKELQEYLTYPKGSAGRIMSKDFLAFHDDVKVRDVIQKIRELARKNVPTSYVYIINSDSQLAGVMNMRDMILADDSAVVGKVMRKELFTVNCFMDREKIAEELSARHYFAAPVVDAEQKLLGVVRADHLIEDVQEEATEDFQKMFGAGGDERVFSSVFFSLKKRLPWLHVNLLTAFLAASVVAIFEDVIAKITVLAVFLPVVAGQGGNAGAQSLAVVMRGMVMREIPPRKVRQLVMKEMFVGAVNGFVVGLVTAGIAWIWHGNPYLGLVIGLAMFVTLVVAGLSGAAIPLSMKAIGLDPAQCSSIILTTITDVIGFFSFLGFATIFIKYL